MSLWFTSDLHFGHANVIKYCNRPFSDVNEMNNALIDNWNEVVEDTDTVFILGDLVMGKIAETLPLVKKLRGIKYLVPGNHDRMHKANTKSVDKRVEWHLKYRTDGGIAAVIYYQEGFSIDIPGVGLVEMCHFPYSGDSQDEDRYDEYRPVDNGRWLLHGHVHDKWKVNGRQINVGVDVNNFRPVHVDEIKEIINGRT